MKIAEKIRKNMIICIALILLVGAALSGCGRNGGSGMGSLSKDYVVGKDIAYEDISDFYYTYENINYNANYLRYRFYLENGKRMFFYERRERPNDYGPATENDRTAMGTVELSDNDWSKFCGFVKDGVVVKRKDSAETGDSGPWLYLYWKKDKDVYREFSFSSYEQLLSFEDFCRSLAGFNGQYGNAQEDDNKEMSEENGIAELVFDSFDGGGPEFTVNIEDESIVSYTSSRRYPNAEHDYMTGAGYTVVFKFTGVRSGETEMVIAERSPIADNLDHKYLIQVDEALTVSITEVADNDDPAED